MSNEQEDQPDPAVDSKRSGMTMYEASLLHSRADRALRAVVSRRLEQFQLTMMEWLLLGTVKHAGKEGLTMSAAASTLDVTLPQVTSLSASLTRAKLLRQRVNRQDRRSRRLVATAAGQKLVSETEEATSSVLDDWLADVPPDEFDAYMKTVKTLADRAHKQ